MVISISSITQLLTTALRLAFGFLERIAVAKKVLIVDDESIARDRLSRFLNETGIFQIQEAEHGLAAIELISEFKPDIIFLDIQMPGLTGFDVLQQIELRNFQIIFQTAYDEYAVQAFEESACDYLLKPFSKERFEKAMTKALNLHEQQGNLRALEEKLHQNNQFLDKISFKQGGVLKIISLNEIACFISQDHCTNIYTINGKEHIINLSIAYLSDHLNPDHFMQCHRSSIVAITQIKAIGGTQDSVIELKNGMKIPLSRSNRSLVINQFSLTKRDAEIVLSSMTQPSPPNVALKTTFKN